MPGRDTCTISMGLLNLEDGTKMVPGQVFTGTKMDPRRLFHFF